MVYNVVGGFDGVNFTQAIFCCNIARAKDFTKQLLEIKYKSKRNLMEFYNLWLVEWLLFTEHTRILTPFITSAFHKHFITPTTPCVCLPKWFFDGVHYNDVPWALRRLKSPATILYIKPLSMLTTKKQQSCQLFACYGGDPKIPSDSPSNSKTFPCHYVIMLSLLQER